MSGTRRTPGIILHSSLCILHLNEPLGRDGFTPQVEVVEQTNNLALARSLLGLLETLLDALLQEFNLRATSGSATLPS